MLTLPVPPSTNNLFMNVPGRGRIKSSEYNRWLSDAGWLLKTQAWEKVCGHVAVTIRIPKKSKADIDNLIKPSLDLLVKHGVIDDDRFVDSIHISRYPGEQMEMEVSAT